MRPRVLILCAKGTNRETDLAAAFEQAGAQSVVMPLTQLAQVKPTEQSYQILALPGGFADADSLGAGKLLALHLTQCFSELLHHFITAEKPVIGICNGFQTLVKAGILPEITNQTTQNSMKTRPAATLTTNYSRRFECHWVTLIPHSRRCLWTQALNEPIDCPIAHGEGRFIMALPQAYETLISGDQLALCYANPQGKNAKGVYPCNPNGSPYDIAGVCNPQGNVLGLMPHPENYIFSWQHPQWTRGFSGRLGLALFQQGVNYVNA
jgi:phosphoribosylformylglycinamidine synthase subunit PurQ / glutaminase